MNFKRPLFALLLAPLLALICVSCNYKLAGTAQPLPFNSIYVKPVQNKSYATQVAPLVTTQIAEMLSEAPNLRLGGAGDAQAVLEVTITDYKRRSVATREDDTALGASFRLELTAKCSLRSRVSGEYMFQDKDVTFSTLVYAEHSGASRDFLGPESQNMPILARGLARRVSDEVLGIW